MARGDRDRDRDRRRTPKDLNRRGKKRVCIFCKDRIAWVDYKDVNLLRRFISDRGKIRARRVSGNCAQHQREVAVAVKTAREMALLPYAQRTVSERSGPRGGGRSSEHPAPSAPSPAGGVPPPPPPRPPRPADVAAAPGAEPGEGSEAPLDAAAPVDTPEPLDAVAAAGASDIEQ